MKIAYPPNGSGWKTIWKACICKSIVHRKHSVSPSPPRQARPAAESLMPALAPPHMNASPLQASTQKLELELADAQQAAQATADQVVGTAERLRVSREEAERAKTEGKRTAADLRQEVGGHIGVQGAVGSLKSGGSLSLEDLWLWRTQ